MVKIFVVVFVVVLSLAVPVSAQSKRANYGPVVKAYLTGLDEELTELEFQFSHQEITRAVYDRTKRRLAVLRNYVERAAAKSSEDRVPELQVLADDELNILAPDAELNPDELKAGIKLGEHWQIVSIERQRERFFVLEKLLPTELTRVVPERKLGPEIDLSDVIETLVIREETIEPPVVPEPVVVPTVEPTTATPVPPTNPEPPKAQTQNPRLLHIYLPEYTTKAREKKLEGEVVLSALLQRDGKIKKIKVEKGLGEGLNERAIEAVKRLGFLPAEFNGEAVDAQTEIVFTFKLEKVSIYVGATELVTGGKF